MTKKSLSDMLKEEASKDPNEELEGKVLRRHSPSKADLEAELQTVTNDRDQLKEKLAEITADRDHLKRKIAP
jgi:septal ring factor EnvC (AmiA/AmiB activator)